MEFTSIDEALAYIKKAVVSSMPEVGEDIKKIMDNETKSQVKGYTNQIFNSVISSSEGMSAEAEFTDNVEWYSLITGEEVGNPIKFLEAGTVWNRDASNIMEESLSKCQREIPDELKKHLANKGIPIK